MKYQTIFDSPVGKLKLVSDGNYLIGLHFTTDQVDETQVRENREREVEPFPEVIRQLDEYFQGKRTVFDIRIRFIGSPFQVRAWEALQSIPYGETISYKKQAERVGSVPRAVGLANGQNPIALIVPCHRVIGADGQLVGYGGGLPLKKALLNFEATVHDFGPQPFSLVPA
jgi:methylated-DNA-[protein]-cysteine S-methyltransferase